MQLLRFDPAATFLSGTGLDKAQVQALEPTLSKHREEIVDIDVQMLAVRCQHPVASNRWMPRFYLMPERLLAEYQQDRRGSELARILAIAKRFQETLDRVSGAGHWRFVHGRSRADGCMLPAVLERTVARCSRQSTAHVF